MKRTRVPGTKALLHASHPGDCPDCGFPLVTAVDKTLECHTCTLVTIPDVVRSPGQTRPRIYIRDVPKKALFPNRRERRRAGL